MSGPTRSTLAAERPSPRRLRRPSGEPPPLPRQLDKATIGWVIALGGWAVVWGWIFLSDGLAIWITRRDLELMGPIVDHRQEWLTPIMQRVHEVGARWVTPVIGWITIVGALSVRRVRHALLLVASLSVTAAVSTSLAGWMKRPRPIGISQIGHWEGFAQPSRPVALLTAVLVAVGLTLAPAGAKRRRWYALATAALISFAIARIHVGVDHPTDIVAGTVVGAAVTLLLYRLVAPEAVFPIVYDKRNTAHLDITGPRGAAIRLGLHRQLGIEVTDVRPVGLSGSAGSTPLRISQEAGPDLFAKLYARSHLRSDRFYKLWRTLRYGRLEDEHRFSTVRRLVQHEHYMLHVLRQAGVDTMQPIGIVELTPDREYLLVSEFLDGAVEIGEVAVTTPMIDAGLAIVARLWEAGLAHRDIKPANIMVRSDRVWLIDVAFDQIRPSPWRQAVDLANTMLVLALGNTPELVYDRALRQFTEDEISEAFAACRGVTIPAQLRADLRADGRNLIGRFRQLAPDRRPVAIQRWTLRRLGLAVWVGFVTIALTALFVGNSADIGLR